MAASAYPDAPGSRRVLVVEDDPLVSMTLEMLLKADGHEVAAVSRAEEAIAQIEQGQYDLVITDLSLGQTDGLTLARKIKRLRPRQPVILCSGSPELMSQDPAMSPDIDYFLTKPFLVENLREAVKRLSGPGSE
jgi:CheY-like chemotaxis protein